MDGNASDLEKMIELFDSIDVNTDGVVDLNELRKACEENKLKMEDVDKWLSKYDANKDKKITADEFYEGLGLNNVEMKIDKEERKLENTQGYPTVDPQIRIFKSTMSMAKQSQVTDKFIELVKEIGDDPAKMEKVTAEMKKYMERRFHRVWHVVVVIGSYWINYCHEPLMTLQFMYGPFHCLIWRTPTKW